MSVLAKNRIWICAGISLAMHVVVLAELSGLLSEADEAPPPVITAQLVAVEPPPPAPKPEAAVAPPRKLAPRPRPAMTPPPARPVEEVPQPTSADHPYAAVAEPEPETVAEAPEAMAEQTAEQPPADAAAQAAAPAETAPPPEPAPTPEPAPAHARIPPVRDLPRNGAIQYQVFLGADKLNIGRTVQTWTMDQAAYRLTSVSETTGLAGFLRPYQLAYVSEGRVDASGLRPDSFSVRRGRNGARQLSARFDWASDEITLGPIHAQRKAALPAGTLDVIALMYQLARADLTPGQLRLSITNGNKLDTYTLEVGAEETLELPLGTVRAVPVRQVRRPGEESMEIWFAPDRGFLPVRIRFLDREGRMSGEQLAAEISLDAR